MMAIAFVALIANTSCLLLISKHREGGAHMKASWIFSANDVVINLGVITAGPWSVDRFQLSGSD
jgi:Co/Zn/Cd efflux system component